MTNRRAFSTAASVASVGALLGTHQVAYAQQGGPRQEAAAVLGGLIDVVVQNVTAQVQVQDTLNNLAQNALQNADITILNDVLNGAEVNVLSGILNNSDILSNNSDFLKNIPNNNEILKNFLNDNNVNLEVFVPVAVNVL
ncbi:MAG: hypothetical protein ACRDI2_18395, partial [Chloroflexota bacterium]